VHETIFTACLFGKLINKPQQMELNLWELKTLKAALETVRDTALKALNQIDQSQEQRSLRWRCKACRYTKYFTTAVTLQTAGRFLAVKIQSLDLFSEMP
jgi:lipopolysaccharide biosynthesis regulator YciM